MSSPTSPPFLILLAVSVLGCHVLRREIDERRDFVIWKPKEIMLCTRAQTTFIVEALIYHKKAMASKTNSPSSGSSALRSDDGLETILLPLLVRHRRRGCIITTVGTVSVCARHQRWRCRCCYVARLCHCRRLRLYRGIGIVRSRRRALHLGLYC
ncbi:hypothetical protein F5Y16DRAFT_373065 [Xylariaceae sp. FL0255]|nr:hypothetical protein F5Y16DRAFT_373065 [Xylariaceae sp. FL0255]